MALCISKAALSDPKTCMLACAEGKRVTSKHCGRTDHHWFFIPKTA